MKAIGFSLLINEERQPNIIIRIINNNNNNNNGGNVGDLPASEELHFARGRVDVAVGTADGTVERGVLAVAGARLCQGRGVDTGPHMRQFYPPSTIKQFN